jgi:hypothetical protein
MKFAFGTTAKDQITGFSGVVTGRTEYISGCTQVLLQPKMGKDGKRPDGEWFDEQRLLAVPGVKAIVLDNARTPGSDIPAPKR